MKQDAVHTIKPPGFEEMTEHEQDQWYIRLAVKQIDQAIGSGKPEEWLHSLAVVKDYLWYLQK